MQKSGTPYRPHRVRGARWDAIVVGSGIGGLTTAALLARHARWRVLVLERHYTPGGFTHSFRRPGFEWDVGLHYVGDVHRPRSLTRRLYDHVSEGRLAWQPMDPVYDRIVIGDDAYDFVAGAEAFSDALARRFPGRRGEIERYVRLVRNTARAAGAFFAERALPGMAGNLAGPLLRWRFLRRARQTTGRVLAALTEDVRLRAVLAGQYGDYGLPPARSSFGIHALVAAHYLHGAAYPVGGGSALAASIAPAIESGGGQILTRAEVRQIVVRNGGVAGVRLADGEEIAAPLVVSDAGVRNTFERLLPEDVRDRQPLRRELAALEDSLSHLCLYVGLDADDAALGLRSTNLWLYPGDDHDAAVARYLADPEAPFPLVYVSFPSAKDPTFAARYPGKATIEMITFAPYEWFAPWADRRWRHRGGDYEALKTGLAQRLLEILYHRVPSTRGHVAVAELSTPLSTQHFAGYARGETYGLAHTPARFRSRLLRPRTPVPGLHLTGQDVVTCGVTGALMAGFITASAILRRNLLLAAARA